MQAGKIKIGVAYAIKHPDNGQLVRFRPTAVVTRRESDHKNPHKSVVEGRILDAPAAVITVKPDEVLGPYEDYQVLVDRKQREKEDASRKDARKRADGLELRRLLYRLVELPIPAEVGEYDQAFRIGFAGSVDITEAGRGALLSALRDLNLDEHETKEEAHEKHLADLHEEGRNIFGR